LGDLGGGNAPLSLSLAVATWVAGFDLLYSCQDASFDRGAGLHSFPARFGIAAALVGARICHLLTVVAFVVLGLLTGLGWLYWAGVIAVSGLFVYEHSLVSPDDLSRLDIAFFSINGYIAVILFAAVLGGRML